MATVVIIAFLFVADVSTFNQLEYVPVADGLSFQTFTHPPFPSLLLLTPVLFILVAYMHMYIYIYMCICHPWIFIFYSLSFFTTSLDSQSTYLLPCRSYSAIPSLLSFHRLVSLLSTSYSGHLDQFRNGIGFFHLNTDGACVSGSLSCFFVYVQAYGLLYQHMRYGRDSEMHARVSFGRECTSQCAPTSRFWFNQELIRVSGSAQYTPGSPGSFPPLLLNHNSSLPVVLDADPMVISVPYTYTTTLHLQIEPVSSILGVLETVCYTLTN